MYKQIVTHLNKTKWIIFGAAETGRNVRIYYYDVISNSWKHFSEQRKLSQYRKVRDFQVWTLRQFEFVSRGEIVFSSLRNTFVAWLFTLS